MSSNTCKWVVILSTLLIMVFVVSSARADANFTRPPGGCVTTDGEIMALEVLYTAPTSKLAIGGNFTKVTDKQGRTTPATNLAVIDTVTCTVVAAPKLNAKGYVRALKAANDQLYVGGDMTSPRNKAFSLKISAGYKLTPWAPTFTSKVYAIDYQLDAKVFLGGGDTVKAVDPTYGTQLWKKQVAGGGIRTLLFHNAIDYLYVGGGYLSYDGYNQVGLVAVRSENGNIISLFKPFPALVPNSNVGTYGSYDGFTAISSVYDSWHNRLVIGIANAFSPGNQLKAYDDRTGLETSSHRQGGDVQAVAVTYGGEWYIAGYHRTPTNLHIAGMPDTGWYGSAWRWSSFGPDGLAPWNPQLSGFNTKDHNPAYANETKSNGGWLASVMDWSTGKLYAGGDFSQVVSSLAVFQF